MANQLQAILKSNKIDIAVGIDKQRSAEEIKKGLQSLINGNKDLSIKIGVELTDNIKDINAKLKELQNKINNSSSIQNAIKLDVTIDSSIKNLSNQIQQIQAKIQKSPSIRPIKLDVDVDVNGSALRIAGELGKIKKIINDFEKDYATALKKVKAVSDSESGNIMSDKATANIKNNLSDVKKYMTEAFGGGEFSTKVFRDYATNVETMSATVKRETGEMYTAMFKLKDTGGFELMKESEVNKMEAQTNKARRQMESLSETVKVLRTNLKDSNSVGMFDKLKDQKFISTGEIESLNKAIRAEKELVVAQQKREALQRSLNQTVSSMIPDISKASTEIQKLGANLKGMDSHQLDATSSKFKALQAQYKSDEQVFRTREKLIKSLQETEAQYNRIRNNMSGGANQQQAMNRTSDIIGQINATKNQSNSVKDLTESIMKLKTAQLSLKEIQMASSNSSAVTSMAQQQRAVEKLIQSLKDIGKYGDGEASSAIDQLGTASKTSIEAVKQLGRTLSLELDEAKRDQKDMIRNFELISASASNPKLKNIQSGIFGALNGGTVDTSALKRYFGELKQGEVNTISVTEKTNQFGQAVNEVKVKMAGTGKTVEAYTFQMNKSQTATQMAVKETGKAIVDNENKSLGFMEQMGIAMKRIPGYILSMQGIYAVVNGFKGVSNEIMEINKQMIEIQRVAGAGINTDNLLTGALAQSKELGNNVHDILDALGEYSRTFDSLSEQQLLTVTKTAVIMSNVSDLKLDESVSSLVGTMNAFNISAEESLHIVDALNEIDNNYSISTKQLAESLSKTGATAQTFGVSMEEVAGATTAIGAVTQESGAIIGNALKTIYSRITTMQPSIDILDSVGVSVRKMGENGIEMKPVNDILGELAGKWKGLTAEQQQNIGVTIAGRNQLSRFLAYMNNWQMGLDATNAGINSSNSAMKEQGIYMQSYEAKINALKTRFTELSLAIGKAFLSDGMMVGIDSLAKLGDVAVKLVGNIGALPAMLGTVTLLGATFGGLGKNLSNVAKKSVDATNSLGYFGDEVKLLAMGISENLGFTKIFDSFNGSFKKTVSEMQTAQTATKGLGTAQGFLSTSLMVTKGTLSGISSAMLTFATSTAGVTLGLTALMAGIGFVTEKIIKAKKHQDDLVSQYNSNIDKSVEQFNKYGNNFDDIITKYDKLNKVKEAGKLDSKQEEEYNNTVKELANILPNAIAYTDANGKAHLKSTEAIKKEAEATAKLNAERLKENDKKFKVDVNKNADDYDKQIKKIDELQEKMKRYKAFVKGGIDEGGKNSEQIALDSLEISNIQEKLSKTLSDNATHISENTQAWLNADGKMKNVTESGKSLIDMYAKTNQYAIDSKEVTENYAKSQETLSDKTKKVGEALTVAYDQLQAIGGEGSKKAIELFDSITGSFSETAKKSKDFPNQIKAVSTAIAEMSSNSKDFIPQDFVTRLENLGMSENQAKEMTIKLGTELENQKIKAMVAKEEMTSYTDEITNMTTATYEAIDGQKKLLNLADGEYEDISSKLDYISSIKKINGSIFNSSAEVQQYIADISAKTGIASSQIKDKTVEITEAYEAVAGKTKGDLAELANMTPEALKETFKGMSDGGMALLQSMLGYVRQGVFDVNDQLMFALKGNKEQVDQHTADLKKSFEELQKAPNDTNVENNFFNGMQENLNQLQNQLVITKDKSGKFVKEFKTLDGSKSTYLDELNRQIQIYGDKLQIVTDKTTGAMSIGYVDAQNNVRTLYDLSRGASEYGKEVDKAQVATGFLIDNFNKMQQAPQDANGLTQWLTGVSNQYESIGGHIELAKDQQGKLAFALDSKGTQNAWLVELNRQVQALGGQIVQTGNEVDGFTYKVNINGQEHTLFTTAGTQADNAKGKIDGAKDSADKLHDSAGKTTEGKVAVDSSSVDEAQRKTNTLQQSDGKTVTVKAQGDTIGLLPITNTINEITQKAETPIAFKTTVLPVDLDNLTQAETLVDSLQDKSGTLSRLVDSIGNQTGTTGNLLDTNVLGKSPLVQTLAGQLADIAKRAGEASTAIDIIKSKAGSISFSVQGSFDLPDDFAKRVDEIIAQSTRMKNAVSGDMGYIKGVLSSSLRIGNIDTSSLDNLRNQVQTKMNQVAGILSSFGGMVANAVAQANAQMVFDASSLINYQNTSVSVVQSLTGIWNTVRQTLPSIISQTTSSMIGNWNSGTQNIVSRAEWTKQNVVREIQQMGASSVSAVNNMSTSMQHALRVGTAGLYGIASTIPAQIGKGISDNMSSASSPIQRLADDMVTKFKSALGIHSPSRVFEQLGGYVIAGLSNGLTGGNLKDLGKTVFKDFGGGVFDTMDKIKAYVSGDFSSMASAFGGGSGGVAGAGVQQWAGVASQALMMTGQFTPQNLQALMYQMQTESGGNPMAINGWDVNAINGTPSKGLMQVIDPTFQANKMPGYNNIYAPLDNILASIRYALGSYGSLARAYQGHGYYNGGFVDTPELAWHGEEGEEAIIPLIPQRRDRGIDLWLQTAQKLGLGSLFGIKGTNGMGALGGGFAGSEGESGSSSSSEGGAGTYVPSITPAIQTMQEFIPMFGESAGSSLDALYKRDTAGLKIDQTQTKIDKSEAVLKRLIENTVAYRNQLLGIQNLNKNLLSQQQAQYQAMIRRQNAIAKELEGLRKTNKHTESQRKRYNELQQEYDTNSGNLWKLETQIENLNNEVRQSNIDIYLDYIADIGNNWDKTISSIQKAKDALSFQNEKLQYTNPNDVGQQLKIQYDMIEQQQKLELTYKNQVAKYQAEYNNASKKYGASSKQAIEMQKMLEDAQKNYNSAVLDTLKEQKAVADAREKVAQDEVSSLKNYYKQMQTLSKQSTEKELENLKTAHDAKIKSYDDEISKINEVYDAKVKERDSEKAEETYAKKMEDFNAKRADFMQKISLASRDNSLEGKKALADLQKQLTDLNKDITDAQLERQDTLWKEQLDKQKQEQLDQVDKNKNNENTNYDNNVSEINDKSKQIQDYYDKLINDDASWKNAVDKWNKGDTSVLTQMMNDMQDELSKLMSGDGKGIMGTENLSPDDIKSIVGDNLTDVSNIWLGIKDQLTELNSINKNLDNLNASQQKGNNVNNPNYTTRGTSSDVAHRDVTPYLPPERKPATPAKPKGVKATHTVVRGDTLWDLAKKYYGDYYQWTKIQKANGNLNPYTVPVGKKLLIPFDTGGYTGDWFGNEGRVAMLHKKEMVLNKNQTSDILKTVSIVDKTKNQLNDLVKSMQASKAGSSLVVGDMQFNFENYRGDKDGAIRFADEVMDRLKSRR
ncbi:putative tail tape measure protein [Lactococcus phage phiL47]|uniref:Putative tail tape measure protein n=1 Tax=Lactococcus phage phiL47 TaxID=1412875 RepID=V9VF10_9CAUD|nr:tail length tape measure protein [Lactococcus phage phiL47]AHC94243.1 putative tail tape measure protein [Lactococcus phage phiL47]